jgi:hypothetical protein
MVGRAEEEEDGVRVAREAPVRWSWSAGSIVMTSNLHGLFGPVFSPPGGHVRVEKRRVPHVA